MLFAKILFDTVKLPSIDADVFTTNPKSGDILAIAEPDCNKDVSNDKLAILILVNPLPSPTNLLPLAILISEPVTLIPPVTYNEPDNNFTDVLTSIPLVSAYITASFEPD